MNILILTNEYPNEKYPKPDWTWVVPYFCREWVEQGHRVIVINNAGIFPKFYYSLGSLFRSRIADYYDVSEEGLSETGWTHRFNFLDKGVMVYNAPMKKLIPGGEYSRSAIKLQVKYIKCILNKEKFVPDIISGHWVNPQLKLIVELKKTYDAKTAIVFHGDYDKKNCQKHRVERYISRIDRVGCRSMFACKTIESFLPVRNTFVCASGIPEEYFMSDESEKIFSEGKYLSIISVGRLVKYKNFRMIIEGCASGLEKGTFCLKLVGEGPLGKELEELISNLGKQDDIKLVGRVSRSKLQGMMRHSDVFALMSKKETFGLVYLEAMAQGCIVIASRNGGMDGILIDGYNGFLCAEDDINEFINTIKNIQTMSMEEKNVISKRAYMTAYRYTNSKAAEHYLKEIS